MGHVSMDEAAEAIMRLLPLRLGVVLRKLPPLRSCATAAIEALEGVT